MKFILFLFFSFFFLTPTFVLSSNVNDIFNHKKWSQTYGAIDVTSIDSLEKIIQKQGPLFHWATLKLASLYNDNQQFEKAAVLLENVKEEPNWQFWKNILNAKIKIHNQQNNQAYELLEKFPDFPSYENNPYQKFYRDLYKQALLLKIEISKKIGKNTNHLQSLVWALDFPDEVPQTIHVPGYVDTIGKLHFIKGLYTLGYKKRIPQIVGLNEIKNLKDNLKLKCQGAIDLASGLSAVNKANEALEAYVFVTEQNCTGNDKRRGLYFRSQLEHGLKKYDAAILSYKKFISNYPDDQLTDDSFYGLWKIYLQSGDKSKANNSYADLMKLPKGDMKEKLLLDDAYIFFKRKKFKKAISLYDEVLKNQPLGDESHPQALYWKARSFEKLKKTRKRYPFLKVWQKNIRILFMHYWPIKNWEKTILYLKKNLLN